MDLRKRLFSNLTYLLLALVFVSVVINIAFLFSDIKRETMASADLTKELIAIGNASCDTDRASNRAGLKELLSNIPLRHVQVSLADEPDEMVERSPFEKISAKIFNEADDLHPEILLINGQALKFTPDSSSELQERVEQMGRTLLILLGFSAASIAAVWWSADSALKPARRLEEFIRHLASNHDVDKLPNFKLKEYEQLGTALNTLADSLIQARNAQKDFSKKIINAIETERESIARDLHDELGQTITALNYNGKFVEMRSREFGDQELINCCAEIRRHTSEMNTQLKAVIKRLRPLGAEVADLVEGINDLIAAWSSNLIGIQFDFHHDESIDLLNSQQTLNLYRIAQECITNVIRHSSATWCQISIRKAQDHLVLEISDNGVGINDSETRIHGGLYGIRERAEIIGADVDIGNGALGGLTVRVSLYNGTQLQKESVQ